MFECKTCKALREENERLHALIGRLLDKVAGPVSPESDPSEIPGQPPPFERIEEKDELGKVIAVEERHTYGV